MISNIKAILLTLLITSFSGISNVLASENPSEKTVFVSASWTQQNLKNIKLIDLSSQLEYQKFHIPQALWVNYEWLIKPKEGIELSGGSDYMARVLSQLGITPQDTLVLYDGMGNLDASRLYWELKKLRHQKVYLLNGGMVSWVLQGYPVTQALPKIQAANYPTPAEDDTAKLTATQQQVSQVLQNPKALLIDTRTLEEYTGDPKEPRTGHIPGAVLFPWDASLDSKNGFQQRTDEQLMAMLAQTQVTDKTQPIILYCNTAHRAARLFPMLKQLGFEQVSLYDGSIQEWMISPNNPLKTGMEP